MTSQRNTSAATPANRSATTNKRFELPALEFKFGSLTDGTDIPPPLPSPVQEDPVAATPPDTPELEKEQQEGASATNGKPDTASSPNSQPASASPTGTKRRAEDGPASPTLSNRPGSIRRLFSRGLLNTAYANGDGTGQQGGRPPSRGAGSVTDSRRAKRSSGWFGRLLTNEGVANKAAVPLSPPATDDKKPTGPPPPQIPELSELNSKLGIPNDSGFGTDLFKDIK
ncbi:10167a48-82f5-4817-bb12-43165a46bc6d [Thermothielavioides terrestris]|uniref:10167a48-82f5-4817-bb12-43165a46bc6d n=1 Tax=Thermothielavioides terrestris TaxID=2587410 RepID=A0A446BAP4_9PEZI|nr:10167a48-82f5-4817-bb12-43165a46bc6d [Thermothielavioides terrestris]